MPRSKRYERFAAVASLLALPLGWFFALQAHPWSIPATYLLYALAVLAIPGTLFWRRLTGGTGWLAVDVVLGTTFGLALECLIYPLGRWLDVPLLPLVLPAVAVGFFLLLPRAESNERPVPWWSLAGVAAAAGVVALWFWRVGAQVVALEGPNALRTNTDSPYQLALAAELTHHFPPQVPYVAGEPLHYHWMVYNHIASAGWITGIELDVLVHRVVPLAFLLLTVLGVGAVAMVLSGRAVAAPIGAGLTALAGDLSPWPWTVTPTLYNDNPLSVATIISPTQALATVLMLPLIAVTTLLLRRTPEQTRLRTALQLTAAAVLIAVLSTTKATALPVYAAGVAGAWAYQLVRHRFAWRRVEWRAMILGVLVAVAYSVNFFVVLGGATHGMELRPAQTFRAMAGSMLSGTDPQLRSEATAVLVIVTVGLLLGWLLPGVGAFLIRRHLPGDPMAVLLVVGLVAAIAATTVSWHLSLAQVFFARAAFAYGILIATWGLASLANRQLVAVAPALVLGAAAIHLGRTWTPDTAPECGSTRCLGLLFAQPMVLATVIATAGVLALGLPLRARYRTWAGLVTAAAIGLTVSPTAANVVQPEPPQSYSRSFSIPPGGIEAARFIRSRSAPDDLIATNIHCFLPKQKRCLTSSFWIPGYAERRVLVQGWAYTAKANAAGDWDQATRGPFWDQEKLHLNDRAFTAPTQACLTALQARYGVRWLLADERVGVPHLRLGELARLRFRAGTVRVYELTPAAKGQRLTGGRPPGAGCSGSTSGPRR